MVGAAHSQLVRPLIAIEPCNKNEGKFGMFWIQPYRFYYPRSHFDLLIAGQTKDVSLFNVFANMFWTKKDGEKHETPSYFSRQDTSKCSVDLVSRNVLKWRHSMPFVRRPLESLHHGDYRNATLKKSIDSLFQKIYFVEFGTFPLCLPYWQQHGGSTGSCVLNVFICPVQ